MRERERERSFVNLSVIKSSATPNFRFGFSINGNRKCHIDWPL